MIDIGIIGTGPAGLTTAIAIERVTAPSFARITLFDRNKTDMDYPGVEYGIQKRASEALQRLGIADAVLEGSHPARKMTFYNCRRHREELSVPVDPKHTHNVLRQDFLKRLTGQISRSQILRDHNVVSIEPSGTGKVTLNFADSDEGGQASRSFDMVICADGSRSKAREQFFPADGLKDQGFTCLYMLVEADGTFSSVPEQFLRLSAEHEVQFSMGDHVTSIYFPEGEGRMVFAFGFDNGARIRFFAEAGIDADADWTSIPAASKKRLAQLLAAETPVHDNFMQSSLELVQDWNDPRIYLWEMKDSDPLEKPWSCDGRIVLVGDSVHAFLPTIGMGASLAIEDAETLGTAIGDYISENAGAEFDELDFAADVFNPWAIDRFPVWSDLIERARAASTNFKNQATKSRMFAAPYIPTRIGSQVVGVAEDIADKLGL